MAAGHVSMAHGLRGPNHAAATACATGAHAIGDAFRAVQRGDADVMVAGGTESCVDPVSYVGFARARALADPAAMTPRASKTKKKDKDIYNGSGEDVTEGCTDDVDPSTACRPFDATRAGFVMGEGAGVLVLESLESARRRGAIPYAEIRGYGQASDAHHITQPPSDGAGASRAMRAALEDGGVRPEDVGYVNAHATGTVVGDAAESRALATVFQERYLRGELSVSSTKGATGHLLGAAGAVEAAFAVLALSTKTLPPTLHLETPCPNAAPAGADLVPLIARVKPGLRAAMTNSFGFGGTNASLVFTSPPGRGGDAE
jgi:3-oxoacyl-[acyl-carrier-protein] synthase II|tara:strand:+ start:429 stop:1379 length:951 start_codon:yes stop_codon:yes gene_type:complete